MACSFNAIPSTVSSRLRTKLLRSTPRPSVDAQRSARRNSISTTALASLEDLVVADERNAVDQLAAAFRGGTAGASIVEASTAATANLDQAGRAVEVAQQAVDTLQAEAETTQRVAGRCPRSRRQARRAHRSRKGRLCDHQSCGRHNWPTTRIFTTSTLAAMHPVPTDRPPPGKRRLARFHRRLMDDPEVELY
jgi:hypothetical protein